MLPSVLQRLSTDSAVRRFPGVWKCLSGAAIAPLPALAAYHRRGMVCCGLSLFSPVFCAWAWRCHRVGLAFCVVDIPQFGLLAQIISLR